MMVALSFLHPPFIVMNSTGDHRTCSPDNLSHDGPKALSIGLHGLTSACQHDLLSWHHEFYECNNKHNSRCKVKEALEHFPISLEMKVFAYYGYSEFWCSGHVPSNTSQLAIKALCLLLHTNKFRRSGSLVFRTKFRYKYNSSTIQLLDETIQ